MTVNSNDRSLNGGSALGGAAIGVSVSVMLFCAVFWQNVLDFKSKLERELNLNEPTVESRERDKVADEEIAPSGDDKTENWREQLAALYPREEFNVVDSNLESNINDAPDERAARFNEFDPNEPTFVEKVPVATLPPAPSRSHAYSDDLFDPNSTPDASIADSEPPLDDEAALVAAAPFDEDLVARDDAPLPEAPRPNRSAYAPDDDLEEDETPDALENDSFVADATSDDRRESLGLDAAPTDAETALPDALDASLALDAGGIAPTIQDMLDAQDAPEPETAPTRDEARSKVAFTGYAAPADRVPETSVEEQSPAVAESSSASDVDAFPTVDESLPNDVSESLVAQDVTVESTSDAPVDRLSEEELAAVANAVFEPSYFSRAVGLFGGQRAFSALYFARAARLVSDATSWSPDSWSRIAPIALAGIPAPRKTTDSSASGDADDSIDPERVSDDADDAPEDDVDADEMHAKYPTLVGYLERRSTATPASQPTAEPNAPAPADADANLSRPDEGRF